MLRVSIGQYSDAGAKPENQDFHGALMPDAGQSAMKGVVLALADGISSSRVSAEAARTAVTSFLADYPSTSDAWSVKTAGMRVIAATNRWLHDANRNAGIYDADAGMACTFSALVLKGRHAHLFHIGDSRIQRLTGISLELLTRDHVKRLSASESYLERALGIGEEVVADYARVPLEVGQVWLITSDGVHDHVDGRTVAEAIAASETLDDAARMIAQAALANGSADNLTCQIVRIDALPERDAALEEAMGPETALLPLPALPKAGDVLDGFTILRGLHSSARSHVYLAKAPDGSAVAIKIPTREMAEDEAYLKRFVLEEWIARRISSPHVLKAAPAPEKRTALYCVTRHVKGRTLRQWMHDHPRCTPDDMRGIVEQIARGLRAFHRKDMLHQDIRPENIMIDEAGTVLIIDFGSTSVAGVEEAAPGTAGLMPGTFQYTAPEYLSGDPVGWRSDLYALGVIAYEMLTGELPYGTQVAKIRSRRDQRALRYRAARGEDNAVPAWLDEALRKAVHPDPLKRHDALSEFLADLRRPPKDWARRQQRPLLERDPVRFWQIVSVALFAALLISLATR
ncbi:bifunctional protein-serine/threonine kinase/phosphatase [Croceicoccus mobilis]|uniref:Protein kinase n=1 Tax=Croceicoccus mobilis TaxID=1703339 RepID=A0A916YVY7_9SPHN|nr:bifunctional protein-serine/threonine kinase/phosphatase [Croceicoccus mobilis]GGD63542.1 protein kinase [Croceicoccus mobilis]